MTKQKKRKGSVKTQRVVSRILGKNKMLELLYAPRLEKTALGVWDNGKFEAKSIFPLTDNITLTPISETNNLIKHGVLLLPSYAEDYGTEGKLLSDIQSFIHRYCDLGESFEIVAAHYVLLTWVYDRFRELPYLRMQGDFGTGKTRFLQVMGSLCYKPLFASGASTISPIFHTLDMFRGTLVMDEADFRFSDEKADIIKILNNGNMKGFPLLRSEVSQSGGYNPRAFNVYGPKVLATRGSYKDPALESRIITKRAKTGHVRNDIPLTLPDSFEKEAESLRNKLLMYRFKNWHSISVSDSPDTSKTSKRVSQIFNPLLAIAQNETARTIIEAYAIECNAILKTARAYSPEEHILICIADLLTRKHSLSIKAITGLYQSRYGSEHTAPVTPKWIGGIIRNRLHLSTTKRNGIYIIPETERVRIEALFSRYEIGNRGA